ncbi:MAG: NADH-quinone oxidoreductase subunit J [Bacteroidetes bacterium]|nr:NADH-quinone oxidoreductase subunit J [Bacteroidota bacterium]MBU1371925.1 NADH-quinone oxidoreductase subunit J [Bacteroidota bacterium]MBU1483527.1 NADH-quinone oxidoreductase subunit J [Bacteroidota bacterium]MBU1759775.1 NADH-quinone oxidoreductase subunit J [Bacteroidota bacterium]MBU2046969.1 NADH-quinone oxidoreductase subunit J [Bacteroidota bacterium]
MSIAQIIFYVLTAIAIGSAAFVVFSQHLVRSVFMFFVTLFAVAGLYVFALADFVALTQVVIYVGGVLVLLLFAFLLSSKESLEGMDKIPSGLLSAHRLPGALISVLFLAVLGFIFFQIDFENLNWIKASAANGNVISVSDNTIRNIGINLMSKYLLPLEMVSILLMMVLIGAANIARKESKVD